MQCTFLSRPPTVNTFSELGTRNTEESINSESIKMIKEVFKMIKEVFVLPPIVNPGGLSELSQRIGIYLRVLYIVV